MQSIQLSQRPEWKEPFLQVIQNGWQRFWVEDPIAKALWEPLLEHFAPFHFALVEEKTEEIMAVGLTVPLAWNGENEELLPHGWHWVLQQSLEDWKNGKNGKTLCAVNAVVVPEFRGRNLAEKVVLEMKKIAAEHGFSRFIAPLRPSQKERYPLMPIEQYQNWKRPDGWPFDSWLRVQVRLGAKIIGASPRSIVIQATLDEWSAWTGLLFPFSGDYIVPGAAVPLQVDVEKGVGTLTSPSIWITHEIR
ncbi:MAG: hypothetical protein Q4E67_03545 [Planctomycetia bacterium]|nr:hypothetical protein [Planctomycetia bacterium]